MPAGHSSLPIDSSRAQSQGWNPRNKLTNQVSCVSKLRVPKRNPDSMNEVEAGQENSGQSQTSTCTCVPMHVHLHMIYAPPPPPRKHAYVDHFFSLCASVDGQVGWICFLASADINTDVEC